MKKILILLSALAVAMIVSCNKESTTTYDYVRLSWALERSDDPIVINFTDNRGNPEQVISFLYKAISDTETLYFVRSPDYDTPERMSDVQEYLQQDFFDKRNISEYYAYIIFTNNEDPKPDRIRIVKYDELAEIFADYIESHPMPEVTTATTS
jgi:hypothetical protein